MSKKLGRSTYQLEKGIYVIGKASSTSQKEADGPIGKYFKHIATDDTLGEETYEKAERRLMEETVFNAISDANKDEKDIDILVGGDLLNQLVTTNYTARGYDIPFLGVYGACSTMAESLIVASLIMDGGGATTAVCTTGSHFSASERQFRNPLELGCQRQTYSQWTVTGMGATVLSNIEKSDVKITKVCIGNVTDYGVVDIANMGAAMAPAAMNTLVTFFEQTYSGPEEYDLIVTGDLGKLGSDILRDLMIGKGYPLGKNYMDCGHSIYNNEQKTFQGGSGAGCSACVLNSYILDKLFAGELKRVVFVATGALMSTTTNQQGDSIPCIAQLVLLEYCRGE
jgi:stage V sporulation protein AD